MRRFSIMTCGIALAVCASLLATQGAWADDAASGERTVRKIPTSGTAAGELDAKTTGANIRASQLIGMNIQNSQGESVGEINDIVLDSSTGKVRYAAVTYGGFLGVGNKMFAVPFQAIKVQRDPDDSDDHILVLNVTQSQLEGATGFDEEHWPNFADRTFTDEIDKRYGVEHRGHLRDRDVDVNVDRQGVDVDVDRKGTDVDVDR